MLRSTLIFCTLSALACAQCVEVTISSFDEAVVAGEGGSGNLVYVVSASNDDFIPESTVVEIDLSVPTTGVTVDSIVASGSGTYDPTFGEWDTGPIEPEDEATLTITLTVSSNAVDGDQVTLDVFDLGGGGQDFPTDLGDLGDLGDEVSVVVIGPGLCGYKGVLTENRLIMIDDGNGNNEVDIDLPPLGATSVTTDIEREVDIAYALNKSSNTLEAGTGSGLDIELIVTNNGPSDASALEIALACSESGGASGSDPTTADGSLVYGSGAGTWTIGDLAAGASRTLSFAFTHSKLGLNGTVQLDIDLAGIGETLREVDDDALEDDTPVMAFVDSDRDALSDRYEIAVSNTDPGARDSDGDGFEDGVEVAFGFDPNNPSDPALGNIDSDGDLLPDDLEIQFGLDPNNADENGDGALDGYHVAFVEGVDLTAPMFFADTNRDGTIGFGDVAGLLQATLGNLPGSTVPSDLDIDRNGQVNRIDVVRLVYVLRKIGPYTLVPID